eukprot:5954163-Pyramimonas_sp.AAC.2
MPAGCTNRTRGDGIDIAVPTPAGGEQICWRFGNGFLLRVPARELDVFWCRIGYASPAVYGSLGGVECILAVIGTGGPSHLVTGAGAAAGGSVGGAGAGA